MDFICVICNKQIPKTNSLYFGFDCLCCSKHCRSQVISINLQIDPTMNNPHTWFIHKLRARKTKQEPLIPKTKSLIDLLGELKL
jgi:hypothetical protein